MLKLLNTDAAHRLHKKPSLLSKFQEVLRYNCVYAHNNGTKGLSAPICAKSSTVLASQFAKIGEKNVEYMGDEKFHPPFLNPQVCVVFLVQSLTTLLLFSWGPSGVLGRLTVEVSRRFLDHTQLDTQ